MIKINDTEITDIKINDISVNKVYVGSTAVWEATTTSYSYVDLGLPSGTLWATTNIGADYPQDCGLWFQWGDSQGYTSSQIGSGADQKYFGWSDYKYSENGLGTDSDMTKYNDTDNIVYLTSEDDSATVNWGSDWHMPTITQTEELCNNCTVQIVQLPTGAGSNTYCVKFISNINNEELILPILGKVSGGSISSTSEMSIWSCMLDASNKYRAYELLVDNGGHMFPKNRVARNIGKQIRPVKDALQ